MGGWEGLIGVLNVDMHLKIKDPLLNGMYVRMHKWVDILVKSISAKFTLPRGLRTGNAYCSNVSSSYPKTVLWSKKLLR